MALRLGFFKVIYSRWVIWPLLNLHIERRTNPILIKVHTILKQPMSNTFKSKNCCYYLIDADIISYFVASKGKKIQKIDENI